MKIQLIIYLLLLPLFVLGQQDYVTSMEYFSVEDGLSDRNVNITFQDRQGFIWFGTRYGLNRFDGHSFKVISKEKNGLESNIVAHIIEDNEGWLWVFPNVEREKIAQISFVHTKTLEVQTIQQRFGNDFPIDLKELTNVIQGKNQSILLSGEGKIIEYKSGQFHQKYETDKYLKITDYTASDKILGIIQSGLNSFHYFELDKTFKSYNIKLPNINFDEFFAIESTTDDYWVYRNADLYKKINKDKWEKINFSDFLTTTSIHASFASGVYFQRNQNLYWYKDQKTLLVFRPYEGVIIDLNKKYPEITKKYIINIFFDSKDNAWIVTESGIYKIRITQNKFTNYLSQPFKDYDLITAFSSRALFVSDTLLYANSNFAKSKIINLNTKVDNTLILPLLYQKNSQPFDNIYYQSNLKIGDNQFYNGYEHLVYYENNKSQKVYTWKNVDKYPMIWWIHQDNSQKIWLGTLNQGIGLIDKDSLSLYNAYNDFDPLSRSSVYHFLNWDDDHLLIASTSGVYILNKNKGIIQRFWDNDKVATKIPHDIIHHIHRDKINLNKVWLATGGGGLISFELSNDLMKIQDVEQYTIVDGLSNNVIYAVYEDDYDNLWIPSDYGIIRFNKKTKKSKAFTIEDGLPFNEFNRISHYQTDDGQLYFGTMNGVTTFHPKDILDIENDLNIPLRITNFQQFDGTENRLKNLTTELINTSKITLNPSDKFFNLEFALLEYKDAGQVKYSYQIEGQSDEWTYLDNNKLRISGLPYDNFILKIRAQGTSGQFSSNVLNIPIRVKRPFYLQWWFIILCVVLAALGIYYWYQQRTKALKERQKELEETVEKRTAQIQKDKNTIEKQAEELRSLDAAKSRFFANVSHELRTPLTLILAPIENSLKRNRLENRDFTNLQMAKNNGQLLLKMVNEILDLSKLEAGKLSLNETVFNGFQHFNNIVENFIPVANEKQIDYQFNFEGNESTLVKLDKQKLQVILINLLSNAFKFTPNNGKISVDIQLNNNLSIEVKDSGRGIHSDDLKFIFDRFYQTKNKQAAAEGGTGIGLALVKELIDLMQGSVKVESELSKGTTFAIVIPNITTVNQLNSTKIESINNKELFIHAQTNLTQKTNAVYLKSINKEITSLENRATLLLVEDNHDLRQFVASLLTNSYEVITAENGAIGWEKLQSNSVDLILSDVMMPVLDGYGLLKKVKTSKNYHQTPMVMLTAKASIDDKLNALRIGVDDYLTKPFIEEELLVRIQNLLQNAAVRKATFFEIAQEEEKINTESTEIIKQPKFEKTVAIISTEQQEWLNKLEGMILKNIEKLNYTVDDLAMDMEISKRQLHRNIKQYIGLTPNKYIRTIRLTKARQLLENKEVDSVKGAAYSVGFRDVTYFSKLFKHEFGIIPSVL